MLKREERDCRPWHKQGSSNNLADNLYSSLPALRGPCASTLLDVPHDSVENAFSTTQFCALPRTIDHTLSCPLKELLFCGSSRILGPFILPSSGFTYPCRAMQNTI